MYDLDAALADDKAFGAMNVDDFLEDVARVEEIERNHPGVRFARESNKESGMTNTPRTWAGSTTARGTIDGNPFYYEYRFNTGTVQVWDGERFDNDENAAPNFDVEPILANTVKDFIEPVAGFTDGSHLFEKVIENLHKPVGDDLYGNEIGDLLADMGRPNTREVEDALYALNPDVDVVQREDSFMRVNEIFINSPSGDVLCVRWAEASFFGKHIAFTLFDPADDFFKESVKVVIGSMPLDDVSASTIAHAVVNNFSEIDWEFDVSHDMYSYMSGNNINFGDYMAKVNKMIKEFAVLLTV